MPEITFTLNGQETTVPYEEGMHFLEVLREGCGITSVKDGCAPQGVCGCCTILLDGRPTLSCLREPEQMAGREVVTLEGLPEAQARNSWPRPSSRTARVQCGFCTPGIAMRAAHLLDRGLTGDDDRQGRSPGHLCRCTGYNRIVDAIQSAAEAWQSGSAVAHEPRRPHFFGEEHGLERTSGSNGTPRRRRLEPALPRPRARRSAHKPFVADMTRRRDAPRRRWCSPSTRGRGCSGIDAAPALAIAGVVRVLTAEDIPGERHVGLIVHDWPLLVAVGETTRYVGDVLAVVVADSQHHARRAAAAVAVDYEVLEPVTDPERGPRARRARRSTTAATSSRSAPSPAATSTRRSRPPPTWSRRPSRTQRIEHAFLEPEACLARARRRAASRSTRRARGSTTTSARSPPILGLEPDRVEVELVTNGGAFGGKEDLSVQGHTALAALAPAAAGARSC